MLGNDRANDFWAARLSDCDELDCDASPEQRRDFITQKYRDGRFRLAHPAFSSQEELLKVRRNRNRSFYPACIGSNTSNPRLSVPCRFCAPPSRNKRC